MEPPIGLDVIRQEIPHAKIERNCTRPDPIPVVAAIAPEHNGEWDPEVGAKMGPLLVTRVGDPFQRSGHRPP